MKIGIVTEYFFPTIGGITENVYHSSREFLRLGHDMRIITGRGEGEIDVEDEIKRRLIFIGKSTPTFFNGSCGRVTRGRGLTRRMKEVLAAERFDIIHLHSPLYPTLPFIANMQANAPLCATYHTCTDNTYLYRYFNGTIKSFYERISGHIAVSRCCAEDNRRFFDIDFDIIPNGVDVEWWTGGKRQGKFDDGKINIIFMGRPDERNGLETLISAFIKLYRRRRDIRLIVVGDGPLLFYFKGLLPSDMREAVSFEGPANTARRDYLASADIMCFTPDIASFGITILEGMSAGKAMIASDIEAFRDLVTDGESAVLIKPGYVDRMAEALERLIDDTDLRQTLGATAAKRVVNYDWKRIANIQLDYYRKVLQNV
jgi:phosphatidylinositol alpha-mannosyltransferase